MQGISTEDPPTLLIILQSVVGCQEMLGDKIFTSYYFAKNLKFKDINSFKSTKLCVWNPQVVRIRLATAGCDNICYDFFLLLMT